MDHVAWLARRGYPEHLNDIQTIQAEIDEIRAGAGRFDDHCQFTQRAIRRREDQIEQIREDTKDRYDNWVG